MIATTTTATCSKTWPPTSPPHLVQAAAGLHRPVLDVKVVGCRPSPPVMLPSLPQLSRSGRQTCGVRAHRADHCTTSPPGVRRRQRRQRMIFAHFLTGHRRQGVGRRTRPCCTAGLSGQPRRPASPAPTARARPARRWRWKRPRRRNLREDGAALGLLAIFVEDPGADPPESRRLKWPSRRMRDGLRHRHRRLHRPRGGAGRAATTPDDEIVTRGSGSPGCCRCLFSSKSARAEATAVHVDEAAAAAIQGVSSCRQVSSSRRQGAAAAASSGVRSVHVAPAGVSTGYFARRS